jgi:hypothetical protein
MAVFSRKRDGRGGYVSSVEGSSSEGETVTTGNRNSELNHCVLIYSYRNNVAV